MFVRAMFSASIVACAPGSAASLSDAGALDGIVRDGSRAVGEDGCTSETALYPIVWVRSEATGEMICDPTFRLISPPGDAAGPSIGVSCSLAWGSCPLPLPDGDTEACTFGLGDFVAPGPFSVVVTAPGYLSRVVTNNTSGYDGRGCGGPYKAPSKQTVTLTPIPAQGTDAASDAR